MPNDVFPDGIQFGYYYNYCEEEEWNDTGARSEATVCCQVSKNTYQRKYIKQLEDGQYKSCEEIFEEYENEETNGSNSDSGPGGSNSGSAKSKMGGEKRIFKSIYF